MFSEPKSSMDLYSGTWLSQVLASALRVLIGFSLASIFGIGLGLVTGATRVGFYLFDHVIQSVRCVPAPAWVPFSVVWFGISSASSITLIALVAFFPVAINTAGGVQNVRPILRDAAAMLGSSRFHTWRRVLLPGALPFIFVGLRLAIGMAWIAVVVSELVGVREGLGYTLFQSYQFGRMDIMICTMFTLGAVGLISDRLMSYLGQKFTYLS
jgi:NitT/TauT family transport system permease protein